MKAAQKNYPSIAIVQKCADVLLSGYFSKKPEDFKKQYERAKKKHEEGLEHLIVPSVHPVIPQLQPLAAMQQDNQFQELAGSAEAGKGRVGVRVMVGHG